MVKVRAHALHGVRLMWHDPTLWRGTGERAPALFWPTTYTYLTAPAVMLPILAWLLLLRLLLVLVLLVVLLQEVVQVRLERATVEGDAGRVGGQVQLAGLLACLRVDARMQEGAWAVAVCMHHRWMDQVRCECVGSVETLQAF